MSTDMAFQYQTLAQQIAQKFIVVSWQSGND
jgi:hypothetical protein